MLTPINISIIYLTSYHEQWHCQDWCNGGTKLSQNQNSLS